MHFAVNPICQRSIQVPSDQVPSTIGLMLFASILSREAGLYLSILCYCYIFYAASMHRAVNRLLRGGNKKTRWEKDYRVRLHFGCSPPEEENADCRRAMINISEYVLDRHSLANNRNTDGEMCFSCTHLYFPYKKQGKR